MERDNHQCVVCNSTYMLNVHHLTYRNVYNEQDKDLITLCHKCHSIYHAVQKRSDFVNEEYEEMDERKNALEVQKQHEDRIREYENSKKLDERNAYAVEERIKREYLNKDYCKNGDLDMCDWSVLNPIIERIANEANLTSLYLINKQRIHKYFLYRRCEFLLRCMDKGLSLEKLQNNTKFDSGWLFKWYRRNKLEAKLNEEKELFGGKEE